VQPLQAVALEGFGVRLEPMSPEALPAHVEALSAAAADGELWNLWFTSVPAPNETESYIREALAGAEAGRMLPWVVRDLRTDRIVGSTRYHDVVPTAHRVEIGYTWYAASVQRTHVNAACKMLLLGYAFEQLACGVVGLRTDRFNLRSQRAIEALGAQRDGVIRQQHARRDGSVRDTVMYSIVRAEWPDVKRGLAARLADH
jgi:RimJ/RimL family protein N-acetyltransferase